MGPRLAEPFGKFEGVHAFLAATALENDVASDRGPDGMAGKVEEVRPIASKGCP